MSSKSVTGGAGGPGRYCVLYPETRGGQFPRDLPKILKAEGKAGYAMTQAEVDTVLNEVVPYWKGKYFRGAAKSAAKTDAKEVK